MPALYEQFNSLGEMLRGSAVRLKDKPAVIFQKTPFSYAQIESFSNQISCFLRKKGIGNGDRIGLYCINSPWFVASYFGILKTGATAVPINLLLSPEEIQFILSDSEAKGLIYFEGFEKTVEQIRDSLPHLRFLITAGKPEFRNQRLLAKYLKPNPRSAKYRN